MIEEINTILIKEKFGNLISKLYEDAKIEIEEINDKLIYSDFLNCFELNNIDYFLEKTNDSIIRAVFDKEIVYNNQTNMILYWCGVQYINIFLNKRIPLKQVFLLCPLNEMIDYFEIYHELNERELINEFIKNKYTKNILKRIRKDKNYSINELSMITDIKKCTIDYYESSNEHLYESSYTNISKLKNILKCDESLFRRKSDFVLYTETLFENKETKKLNLILYQLRQKSS